MIVIILKISIVFFISIYSRFRFYFYLVIWPMNRTWCILIAGLVIGRRSSAKAGASTSSQENLNLWETRAKFERMTYWNHDSLPSKDDPMLRSLHWLPLAEVVSFFFLQLLKGSIGHNRNSFPCHYTNSLPHVPSLWQIKCTVTKKRNGNFIWKIICGRFFVSMNTSLGDLERWLAGDLWSSYWLHFYHTTCPLLLYSILSVLCSPRNSYGRYLYGDAAPQARDAWRLDFFI